jgi:hypothetical protein
VYPCETDSGSTWATDDDDHGRDNREHSVMPRMTMNWSLPHFDAIKAPIPDRAKWL